MCQYIDHVDSIEVKYIDHVDSIEVKYIDHVYSIQVKYIDHVYSIHVKYIDLYTVYRATSCYYYHTLKQRTKTQTSDAKRRVRKSTRLSLDLPATTSHPQQGRSTTLSLGNTHSL